jgi:kinetochore protein Nuf2
MAKQLANAREKIERTQQHIGDKRIANKQAIGRLEKGYENMDIERRDTSKHNEELRAEADEIERKVCRDLSHPPNVPLRNITLAQMADHLKRSEAELGELLAEYWALRNRTCE